MFYIYILYQCINFAIIFFHFLFNPNLFLNLTPIYLSMKCLLQWVLLWQYFFFFLVNVFGNESDLSHLEKAQYTMRLTELALHSTQQLLFLTDTTAPGIECPAPPESWEHDMTSHTETLSVKQPCHQQAGQWASVAGRFWNSGLGGLKVESLLPAWGQGVESWFWVVKYKSEIHESQRRK